MTEDQKEAVKELADWCEKFGCKINAMIVLMSDDISDNPIGVNTCSTSSISELRKIGECE